MIILALATATTMTVVNAVKQWYQPLLYLCVFVVAPRTKLRILYKRVGGLLNNYRIITTIIIICIYNIIRVTTGRAYCDYRGLNLLKLHIDAKKSPQ